MKFASLSEWLTQLRETYPHAVRVNTHLGPVSHAHMVEWLKMHVGSPYDAWVNNDQEYLFKCYPDAIKFSLAFT